MDSVKTRSLVWRGLSAFAVALAAVACQTTPGTPGRPDAELEYHVAAPDVLEINVRPEPAIERSVVVRPDGRISLELIGDIYVEGLTVQQIRAALSERLREYIVQPDVTVVLQKTNSRVFYVFGEVRKPGAFAMAGAVDVLQAYAMAGGGSDLASLDSALLVRPTAESDLHYPVFINQIVTYGKGATNYELQPGDVIYVPPTIFGQIGYAIRHVFFPIQSILGVGGRLVRGSL